MNASSRLPLLLCIAVFGLGVFYRIIPNENAVKATTAHSETVLQEAVVDERALADEPRVRFLAQRIRNDLRGTRLHPAAGDASQELLGDIQTAAARNHLTVTGVKPLDPDATPGTRPVAATPQESDVSVRGSYHDVVFFLEALSHMPTLARVLSAELAHENDQASVGQTPFLDATIRIQTISLNPIIP